MFLLDFCWVFLLNSCFNDNVFIFFLGLEEIGLKDFLLFDFLEILKDFCFDFDRDFLNEFFFFEGFEEEVLKFKLLFIEFLDELLFDCNFMGFCDDFWCDFDNGVEVLDWD